MSHVEAALREIDDRIDAIDAERGRLDQARETLRGLLSGALPLKPTRQKRETVAAAPRGASDGALDGRILAVLARGPLAPGELAEKVKADRLDVRRAVTALAERGKVRVEGATMNRRVMLAGAAPKEAVQ